MLYDLSLNRLNFVKFLISYFTFLFTILLLFVPNLRAQEWSPPTNAMIVYGEGSVVNPRYRIWHGPSATLRSEKDALSAAGTIQWVVLKSCPKRNEKILGTLDNTGKIRIQVWNGSAWGNQTELGSGLGTTQDAYRGFDIAYEQNSGKAIVVFVPNNTAIDPQYVTWDGSAWSSPQTIDIGTTGIVYWVRLAHRPNSNQISLMTLDANSDIYGIIWDGTIWADGKTLTTSAAIAARECIAVEYEQQSGRAIFLWGSPTATDNYYWIWDGSAWVGASATLLDIPAQGGVSQWVMLRADPNSNKLMAGFQDAALDLNTRQWDGSSWNTAAENPEHDGAVENVGSRNFDLVYETFSGHSGHCWLVWGDGATVSYREWTGAAWQAIGSPTGDDDTAVVQLVRNRDGILFALIYEDPSSASDDLKWMQLTTGGGTWSGLSQVENTLPLTAQPMMEPVMMSPDIDDYPPGTINNLSAIVGDVNTIRLIWTEPGADSNAGGPVSQYRIKYATFSVSDLGGNTTTWWNHPATLTSLATYTPVGPANTGTTMITGLTQSVTYYFKIRAQDGAGNWSDYDTTTTQAYSVPGSTKAYPFIDSIENGWDGWTEINSVNDPICEWHICNLNSSSPVNSYAYHRPDHSPADYNTGLVQNNGSLTSPVIDFSTAIDPRLTFWNRFYVESYNGQGYDEMYVEISVNGGAWTTVANWDSQYVFNYGNNPGSSTIIDLSSYSGSTMRVRFRFDTGDASSNAQEGWTIDHIRIGDEWIPPAAVTNLSGLPGTSGGKINLSWTSPGDDWNTGVLGTAAKPAEYRIDYSTYYYLYNWDLNDYDRNISTYGVTPGTNVNYTVTGLTEGTTYYLRIWARDESYNWSEISNGATTYAQIILPAAITNLSALAGISGGEIKLSWTAPGDDGWSGTLESAKWRIAYSTDPAYNFQLQTYNIELSTTCSPLTVHSCVITGLTEGTTYFFHIWTRDENPNNWSDISNGATTYAKIILPSAITNLSALTGKDHATIELSWTSPGDDGTSGQITDGRYKIKWSTQVESNWSSGSWIDYENRYELEFSTNTPPLVTQVRIVTGLAAGTTYYFRIWTADESGICGNISNGATIYAQKDDSAPATITDLVAIAGAENGEIDIQWTAPGDDGTIGQATKYVVKYSTAEVLELNWTASYVHEFGQNWQPQLPGTIEYRTITGLTPGEKYYVAIKTQDEKPNTSAISNSPYAYAQSDPIPPCAISNLTALTGTYKGQIILIWTAPGDDDTIGTLTSYLVKYSTIGQINNETDFIAATTYYQSWTPLPTGSTEEHILEGLESGTTHWISIKGADEKPNYGALSTVRPSTSAWAQYDTKEPSAITSLSATPGTGVARIDLLWYTPGDDGWVNPLTGKFRIDYDTYTKVWSYTNYKKEIFVSNLSTGTLYTYTLNNLIEGATYFIRIWSADNVPLWSDISNGATTWATNVPPAAITQFTATTGTNEGEVQLTWTAVGDDDTVGVAARYLIRYNTSIEIDESVWSTSIDIPSAPPAPSPPGTTETLTVTGLLKASNIYFGIKTQDEVPNISELDTVPGPVTTVKEIPPSAITTLSALTGANWGQVKLSWIAPGNDGTTGNTTGGEYRIQRSTYSPPAAGWSVNNYNLNWSTNTIAGNTETMIIPGLTAGVTYYFRIWFADERPNWTEISNGATAYASTLPYSFPFSDNLEGSNSPAVQGNWTIETIVGSTWTLGTPVFPGPGSAHTGSNAYKTGVLDGNYANSTNARLTTPWVDLTTAIDPRCIFYMYRDFEGTATNLDGGFIQISTNSGQTWTQIPDANITPDYLDPDYNTTLAAGNPYPGTWGWCYDNTSWTKTIVNLQAYTGNVVAIRYVFGSDAATVAYGWCVDTLSIAEEDIPPDAITNLSALPGTLGGEINLSWISPGDDSWTGDIVNGKFRIDYSTYSYYQFLITNYKIQITTTCSPLTVQSRVVTGLTEGVTYYFRIWTRDEIETNWSGISNGATTYATRESPAAITNLSALTDTSGGEVKLSWTSPGDNGWSGTLSTGTFRIDYATYTKIWNYTDYQIFISTYNVVPYTEQSYTITGLIYEATYYFRIWTADKVNNWSGISNGATAFVLISPAAITNLSALTGPYGHSIKLTWTAPGDDRTVNNITGGLYKVRYSTYALQTADFWSTGQWNDYQNKYEINIPTNTLPGNYETKILTGLSDLVTYYIRIWTRDENDGNWSEISNGATTQAQITIISVTINQTTYYDFGLLDLGISTINPTGISITNTGNLNQKYLIKCTTVTAGGVSWGPAGNPSFDTFTLKSAFNGVQPSTQSFSTEDIVWSTNTYATSTVYSIDGTQTGIDVPPNENRTLWILLNTPLDTSTTVQQRIKVYITAVDN